MAGDVRSTNVYGRGDVFDHLLAYPSLTHAQCDAIAELAATLKPAHRVDLLQTHTGTGGTHLYVRAGRFEFHVAANGNVVDLGAY